MVKKIQIIAAALCAIAFPSLIIAQSEHSLVGTWKLVSVSSWTDKGEINRATLGPHPTGFLTYTPEGRMMVVIAEDGRKPLSIADRVSAPAEERAQAFSTFNAYAGRYTLAGDKVTHHVEVASFPNDVNTDLVRSVKLQGDRLTLRTPPILRGGVLQTLELVWERLKK
jgi:hypothetical protein